MCTVKKDLPIADGHLDDDTLTISHDYDRINRKQSQLLLNTIYSTPKTGGLFPLMSPCPKSTLPSQDNNDILEEIRKLKVTVSEIQQSIKRLPEQLAAACQKCQCKLIEAEIDSESDIEDEEFEKLCSAYDRTLSTSSSDIEVLHYCNENDGQENWHNITQVVPSSICAIDKEIISLTNRLKSISTHQLTQSLRQPTLAISKPPTNLFSYWEERYLANKNASKAPIGNIRTCSNNVNLQADSNCAEKGLITNILPYNSTIDLNV